MNGMCAIFWKNIAPPRTAKCAMSSRFPVRRRNLRKRPLKRDLFRSNSNRWEAISCKSAAGIWVWCCFHRDKSETIPIVKDVQQLEYDLTSRIAKMAVRTKKVIAVTSGHGEISLLQGSSGQTPARFGEDLKELYDFSTITRCRSTSHRMPVQADALLVIGPKQKFDDKSLWVIDQAIMRGIPTAFFVDSKNLMINQFYVTLSGSWRGRSSETLRRPTWAISWCMTLNAKPSALPRTFRGLLFTTSMRYPYIPLIDRIALNNPVTRGLDTVGLPFVTTVEPDAVSAEREFILRPLLYTSRSEAGWRRTSPTPAWRPMHPALLDWTIRMALIR